MHMSLLKFFKSLFHKETEMEKEERLEREALDENEEMIQESYDKTDVPMSVIRYIPSDDGESGPQIDVLVESFSARMIPEIGSIIHIIDDRGILRPHKCIRFDFIENGSEYDSMRTYVVVEPATASDVIPNPRYS